MVTTATGRGGRGREMEIVSSVSAHTLHVHILPWARVTHSQRCILLACGSILQGIDGAHNLSATAGFSGSYGTLTNDIAERKAGMVRATQAYLWSQTQGPGGAGGGDGVAAGGSMVRGKASLGNVAAARPRHVAFPSQTQSKMLAPRLSGAAWWCLVFGTIAYC